MKEQSPLPNYAQDEHGLYNQAQFDETGEKFRPLDFVTLDEPHMIVVDEEVIFDRQERQALIASEHEEGLSQTSGTTGETRNTSRQTKEYGMRLSGSPEEVKAVMDAIRRRRQQKGLRDDFTA